MNKFEKNVIPDQQDFFLLTTAARTNDVLQFEFTATTTAVVKTKIIPLFKS